MRKPEKKMPLPTNKDSGGDDFFEIKRDRTSANRSLHILACVICVIFAWWVWMLNPTPQIHGDQMNIVTMVLSKEHPDNFARDPVWGGKTADSYPPLYRGIIATLISKFGIIGGHRLAQFPLSIAYLFVMYGALYYLTRSVPASVLVALASLIWRWSLAETYWGLSRMQSVQPRSFVLIFIPMLFVLFWKLRDSWWLLVPFFIAGLLFNLNPPSAMFFVILSGASLFLVSLHNRNRILRLIGAVAASVVGAMPYVYVNMAARSHNAVELSGQMLQEYMSALEYLYRTISYFPLSAATLTKVFLFGFSVPLLLAATGWCLRQERRNKFDTWLVRFFLLVFVGPVIVQYSMQRICVHFKIAPVFLDCMRAQKFAYLVLYIYIAWLLAELLGRLALRERFVLIVVAAAIVAIMPLFGNNSRDPWGQWSYNTKQMGMLLKGEKIEIAGWHNQIANVCTWARQKTPKDSLFLFTHRFMDPFRIYALRSMVTSRGAGSSAYYNGPETVSIWAKYQQQLEQITARQDVPGLLKLAEISKADYIIVSAGFPEVTGWLPVMRDRFWMVYKKTQVKTK